MAKIRKMPHPKKDMHGETPLLCPVCGNGSIEADKRTSLVNIPGTVPLQVCSLIVAARGICSCMAQSLAMHNAASIDSTASQFNRLLSVDEFVLTSRSSAFRL